MKAEELLSSVAHSGNVPMAGSVCSYKSYIAVTREALRFCFTYLCIFVVSWLFQCFYLRAKQLGEKAETYLRRDLHYSAPIYLSGFSSYFSFLQILGYCNRAGSPVSGDSKNVMGTKPLVAFEVGRERRGHVRNSLLNEGKILGNDGK